MVGRLIDAIPPLIKTHVFAFCICYMNMYLSLNSSNVFEEMYRPDALSELSLHLKGIMNRHFACCNETITKNIVKCLIWIY